MESGKKASYPSFLKAVLAIRTARFKTFHLILEYQLHPGETWVQMGRRFFQILHNASCFQGESQRVLFSKRTVGQHYVMQF